MPDRLTIASALREMATLLEIGASEVEIAGELRRWMESVDSLSLVVASDSQVDTVTESRRAPFLADVTAHDPAGFAGHLTGGLPVSVSVVPRQAYATTLLRATGSAAHVQHLERLARERGDALAGESEAEIYRRLGLPFIPAELGEGESEVEAAMTGALWPWRGGAGSGGTRCSTR